MLSTTEELKTDKLIFYGLMMLRNIILISLTYAKINKTNIMVEVVYVLLWKFFKDLTQFIEPQMKNILFRNMFINRKRNMLNWKCVYLIEIGYFIKS